MTRANLHHGHAGAQPGRYASLMPSVPNQDRSLIILIAAPGPPRDFAERVQVGVAGGVGVLQRDLGAELDMGADRVAERLVAGHADGVERGQGELDAPLALLFSDLQVAMDVDGGREAELAGER